MAWCTTQGFERRSRTWTRNTPVELEENLSQGCASRNLPRGSPRHHRTAHCLLPLRQGRQWRVATRYPKAPQGPLPRDRRNRGPPCGNSRHAHRRPVCAEEGRGCPKPANTKPQRETPATATADHAGHRPPHRKPTESPSTFRDQAYSLAWYCACSDPRAEQRHTKNLRSLTQHRTERQDHSGPPEGGPPPPTYERTPKKQPPTAPRAKDPPAAASRQGP